MPAAKRGLDTVLYGVLALLFIMSTTYRALDITERVAELRNPDEYVRDPFDIDLPYWELQGVEPEAEQAGLQVRDAGVGFDGAAALKRGTSSGLSGMKERAELLGGEFILESAPGEGTCLTVELPLPTLHSSGSAPLAESALTCATSTEDGAAGLAEPEPASGFGPPALC